MKSDKKSTIYDVAEKAKVSLATVSRVLNSSGNVRPQTVEKVQAAIDMLNYHPDEIARGLASKKTTTVGILFPNTTDLLFSEVMDGISDVSQIYDYNIFFVSTEKDFGLSNADAIEKLLTRKIDGLILLANDFDQDIKKIVEDSKVPYVLLGGLIDTRSKLNQISIDIKSALSESLEYLTNLKSQRIAFLNYSKTKKDQQKLSVGFNNQDVKSLLENSYQAGYQSFEEFDLKNYDAIITSHDQIATGLAAYGVDHQISIPEKLKIVSLQDTNLLSIVRPQISAINYSRYDVGAISMRMLTKLMNHEELDDYQVVLPYQLIKRSSSQK